MDEALYVYYDRREDMTWISLYFDLGFEPWYPNIRVPMSAAQALGGIEQQIVEAHHGYSERLHTIRRR